MVPRLVLARLPQKQPALTLGGATAPGEKAFEDAFASRVNESSTFLARIEPSGRQSPFSISWSRIQIFLPRLKHRFFN